jgi:hypothetical protein
VARAPGARRLFGGGDAATAVAGLAGPAVPTAARAERSARARGQSARGRAVAARGVRARVGRRRGGAAARQPAEGHGCDEERDGERVGVEHGFVSRCS